MDAWKSLSSALEKHGGYEWIQEFQNTNFPVQYSDSCWLHSIVYILTSRPLVEVGVWAKLLALTGCDKQNWESKDSKFLTACINTIVKMIQNEYTRLTPQESIDLDSGGASAIGLYILLHSIANLNDMQYGIEYKNYFKDGESVQQPVFYDFDFHFDQTNLVDILILVTSTYSVKDVELTSDEKIDTRNGFRYAGALHALKDRDEGEHAIASATTGNACVMLRDPNLEAVYESRMSTDLLEQDIEALIRYYKSLNKNYEYNRASMVYVRVKDAETLVSKIEELYNAERPPPGSVPPKSKENNTSGGPNTDPSHGKTESRLGDASFDTSVSKQLFKGGNKMVSLLSGIAVILISSLIQ